VRISLRAQPAEARHSVVAAGPPASITALLTPTCGVSAAGAGRACSRQLPGAPPARGVASRTDLERVVEMACCSWMKATYPQVAATVPQNTMAPPLRERERAAGGQAPVEVVSETPQCHGRMPV